MSSDIRIAYLHMLLFTLGDETYFVIIDVYTTYFSTNSKSMHTNS